jgi:hypothetical protein
MNSRPKAGLSQLAREAIVKAFNAELVIPWWLCKSGVRQADGSVNGGADRRAPVETNQRMIPLDDTANVVC